MGPKGIAKALRTIAGYPGALTAFAVAVYNTSKLIRQDKDRINADPATNAPGQMDEARLDLENAIAIRVMESFNIPPSAIDAGKLAQAIVAREWGDWVETDPILPRTRYGERIAGAGVVTD